jgi:TPR repeat protein
MNILAYIADNISAGGYSGSDRMEHIGWAYKTEKKQNDRALAWFILAAMENYPRAQNNIGNLYYHGEGVPKNYLCTLKWYLKAAEKVDTDYTPNYIGLLFEDGRGISLDKYKALEWHCRGWDKTHRDRLIGEGYHRSATDKSKFNHIIDSLY